MLKWIIETIYSFGYWGIVFLMFLENVFPPIPSEFIIPLAGFLVTEGRLGFFGVVAAGTLGSILGALPIYYFGKTIEEKRLREWVSRYGRWLTVSCREIDRAEHWFEKFGGWTVFFGRFVPGIRSLISLPAGIGRMKLLPFLFYSALGMALWTTILTLAGYILHANFRKVEEYLDTYAYFIIFALVAIYIFRVINYKK